MITKLTERFLHELEGALPGVKRLLPRNELHIALQAVLGRLNVVSREEFDTQTALLQRTCLRLEALEKQCAELEHIISTKN